MLLWWSSCYTPTATLVRHSSTQWQNIFSCIRLPNSLCLCQRSSATLHKTLCTIPAISMLAAPHSTPAIHASAKLYKSAGLYRCHLPVAWLHHNQKRHLSR